jgi:uncharacterized membrane protein YphA (DoxX/SURF4 family)
MSAWFPVLLFLAGLTGLGAMVATDLQPAGVRAARVTVLAGTLALVACISTLLGVTTFL